MAVQFMQQLGMKEEEVPEMIVHSLDTYFEVDALEYRIRKHESGIQACESEQLLKTVLYMPPVIKRLDRMYDDYEEGDYRHFNILIVNEYLITCPQAES